MGVAILWLVALAIARVLAGQDPPLANLSRWEDGSDLESYISRPDIKAPKLVVAKYKPELIRDGYWFISPYSHFDNHARTARREFLPCQTGAHIYDGDGNLVWSGACWGGNQNVFGFKPITIDGEQFLTMYLSAKVLGDKIKETAKNRSAVILDEHYRELSRTLLNDDRRLDFHEFNVQADGKTALVSTSRDLEKPAPELDQKSRRLMDTGFQEIEIGTGKPIFTWNPLDHGVLLNESCDTRGRQFTNFYWDFFHVNAIDKNLDGDYLVSARHTCTVYKVSGQDGHIIWRLGGNSSDFVMEEGLEFFWQHDVRFRSHNQNTTIISVFDNAGDDDRRNPALGHGRSSAKIIVLDTASNPMTARLLRRIDRPDGDWSPKLGSVQLLGSDAQEAQVLVNWGLDGYLSEHDAKGDCLVEAKFISGRMSSYRAYKEKFVGRPTEPPALKLVPMKADVGRVATAFHVSWNGATEVASWNFYSVIAEKGAFTHVGSAAKMGFETSWVMPSLAKLAYAEAIDSQGNVLGRSETQSIAAHVDGEYRGFVPVLNDASESKKVAHTPKVSISSEASVSKAVSWLSTLMINGFALWGLYCLVRRLVSKDFRWR